MTLRRFTRYLAVAGLVGVLSCGTDNSTRSDEAGASGHELLLVPAGPFLMGSDTHVAANQPAHTVYLDSFYIDRFEVTEGQYRACYDSGVCPPAVDTAVSDACTWLTPGEMDHPINCLTWEAAGTYCQWAGLRLPTEAEWEKAARSDDGRTFPWGEEYACERGNFDDDITRDPFVMPGGTGCDGYDRTAPVGSFPLGVSVYGAEDMAGNVAEYVSDWWTADYYKESPAQNPPGPTEGPGHPLRGGNWDSGHETLWTWARARAQVGHRDMGSGFRCAGDR